MLLLHKLTCDLSEMISFSSQRAHGNKDDFH